MAFEEAELKLMHELSRFGKAAVNTGLVHGSGGNLSARLPGSSSYIITKSATWLDELGIDDFVKLDIGANHPLGQSSEWPLHDRSYARHPEINAMFHLHPQDAVLLDALGKSIRLFTLDDALYVNSIGIVDYYPNGSFEMAADAAEQLAIHNCLILRNHGSLTVGEDIKMAFRRSQLLEQAAENTFKALLLGDKETEFPKDVELRHA